MFKGTLIILLLVFGVQTAFAFEKKTVGLWSLMLWFNDGDYRPWEMYVRYFPVGGIYNSYDVAHIDKLINSADDLGVDYLILDNTNGAFRHDGRFNKTISLITERIKFHKSQLKISIAIGYGIYEKKDFQYHLNEIDYIKKYFNDESYYQVNGKPLLILYINPQDKITNITKDPKFGKYISTDDRYGYRNFFTDYTIRYASGANDWLNDPQGLYGWQFKKKEGRGGNRSYPTMGVMPGWNRSHNQLTGSKPVERNGGKFYRESWMNVIRQSPANVIVTSWDDWAEETAIAPSIEWGNTYYDITKNMIKKYKSTPILLK